MTAQSEWIGIHRTLPVLQSAQPGLPGPPQAVGPSQVRAPRAHEAQGQQSCGECRSLPLCWNRALKPKAIVVGLLVCRLQRGIAVSATTKTLLELFAGKLKQLLRGLEDGDEDGTYVEAQTEVIELLRREYIIGSRYHPLFWLFSRPNGAMTRWAAKRKSILEDYRYRFELYPSAAYWESDFERDPVTASLPMRRLNRFVMRTHSAEAIEFDPRASEHERTARMRAVLDDGVTLTAFEYRVLSFCLNNAHDHQQPIQGLHESLAKRCNVRRTLVQETYQHAIRKVLDVSGYFEQYLTAHGLSLSRAARRHRTRHTAPLSLPAEGGASRPPTTSTKASSPPAEVVDMDGLHRLREQGVSWPELGWLFGVSARKLPALYANYCER